MTDAWAVILAMIFLALGYGLLPESERDGYRRLFSGINLGNVILNWGWKGKRSVKLLTGDRLLLRKYVRQEARSARFFLSIAVWLLPPSERARYIEEVCAELLDLAGIARLRHAISVLRGAFMLRLRHTSKNKPTDAAERRPKG